VDRIVVSMLHYLYYVNFLLAVFNLIPGFPLDGGRVLRSYLWHRSGSLRQATRSAARVGEVFAAGFMLVGLASMLMMHFVPGLWLILIGMFLKKSAVREHQSFEARVSLQDVTLRDIMAPPVAVNTSMTIADFVNGYVFHYHNRVFPVLELNRFVGMVDVRAIKGVPAEDWPVAKIGAFLADPSTYTTFSPDMDATEALKTLIGKNYQYAPVVQNENLLGLITRDDLFKVISLKSEIAA
jgi:CBS domain-containing protein